VLGGSVEILVGESIKTVRLTRAHLEEDAGKSLHEDFHGMSGIDLNRAGTPLLEIVSEPDLRGPAEAVAYGRALHALVRWLDICDGNMQEGSFRMDANVSVRPAGEAALGTRCEIKNLNSFRFLERAIQFEVARQIAIREEGGSVRQETRLYDPDRDETRTLRTKEDAHDYRYFPDPDLLPLELTEARIACIREAMPELPQTKVARYAADLALTGYDARLIAETREKAAYFEAAVAAGGASVPAKLVANWVNGDLASRLNAEGRGFDGCPVAAGVLAMLLVRVQDGTISHKIGREQVLPELWAGESDVDRVIDARGLRQISDAGALERIADEVIATNAAQVADYRSGKAKAFNALVGQVMKATRGKANPQQINEILKRKLG